MKQLLFIAILLLLKSSEMQAQKMADYTGEYHLSGVMETASGFKLNADSTFEFYFSYGALDRGGSGKWTLANGQLILNSKPWTGHDFKLVKSAKNTANGVRIQIAGKEPMILNYVHAGINNSEPEAMRQSNGSGVIDFKKQRVDSIALIFEFAPERTTVIHPSNKDHNYFEFELEPSYMEVFFRNYVLNADGKELTGTHPLLKPGIYRFEKSKSGD